MVGSSHEATHRIFQADSCLAEPAMQSFWRHTLAEQVREDGREEGRVEALPR
ncbi:hypothetical protein ACFYO5_37150 [Streptomyces sp. NPDC006259]|uniref:hypothetical protein n=1 Tax=Streptomyces sp. NPDC006259 TaxID=3364740 RepID=UPI00368A9E0F